MSRRASSTVHPAWVMASLALVAGMMTGGWFLYQQVRDPYRTLTPLDVPAYLENANSLRGNVYKISGEVGAQLAWSPSVGRLYEIEVEGKNSADVLPVMIPAQFNHLNIQRGQRYFFKIDVGEKGILRVQDVQKV